MLAQVKLIYNKYTVKRKREEDKERKGEREKENNNNNKMFATLTILSSFA